MPFIKRNSVKNGCRSVICVFRGDSSSEATLD